jgi:hypothetical protein
MFARHLIGPAAELGHLNLLAEVNHEQQLALAAGQKTSPGARSGASAPTTVRNRIVHAARSLRPVRAMSVFGTGYLSRPQ